MATGHFFHKSDLVKILDACLNKTLGEVDVNRVFDITKNHPKITGIAGDVIEQSVLGYPADNKQEPDLNIDGVKTELKTTGIRLSKREQNKYEAKEPMSVTAVSPDIIVTEIFDNSMFWHKLEHLLLVYYLYVSDKAVAAAEYARFPIKGYQFYEFSEEDKAILENDWTTVRDFLVSLQRDYENYENQYPRLSSELRDKLMFIDTAPKWPNPPRFRLKRTVITNIVQAHFGDRLEQLPSRYTSFHEFNERLHKLAQIYHGKTVKQLANLFGITGTLNNKSIGEQIIVRMFGGQGKKMQQIEFFNKVGLTGKTIVLTETGLRTEDMKLFCIDFDEVTNPDIAFEESAFQDFFANRQIMCIVFEEPSVEAALQENRLLGFKRIVFDDGFIGGYVKPIWERIRELIFSGQLQDVVELDKKTGKPRFNKTGVMKSAPNFPKAQEGIIFVRGGGSDSSHKPEEINGIRMYRQWIWLKGSYIADRLAHIDYI